MSLAQNLPRMKRTQPLPLLPILLAGTLLPVCAHGVTVSTPALPQNAFGIEIKEPYQSFFCRDARNIMHISLQKYISAQAAETSRVNTPPQYITEMTIDFAGMPGQVRIYAMEEFDPVRLAQKIPQYGNAKARIKNMINKGTKSNVTNVMEHLVVKTYPHSTHAKTIEFRVPDAEEVVEFYKLFRTYYLRSRKDYRYFGKLASEASKQLNESNFHGVKIPAPANDWEKAAKDNSDVVKDNERILVSGLSGLLFTLGTPDTVATEIERQDVNKK